MRTARTPRATTEQVIVRAFESSDLESVARIQASPGIVVGELDMPFQAVDELRASWAQTDPMVRKLVAEVGGHVVGVGRVTMSSSPRMRHVASLSMRVLDDGSNELAASVLLDALIALAEDYCGVLRLEVTVYVDKASAIGLVRSRNFLVEGVARAYALHEGVLLDALHMARITRRLPWPRRTAEESSARKPPQLAPRARTEPPPPPQGNRRKKGKPDLPN